DRNRGRAMLTQGEVEAALAGKRRFTGAAFTVALDFEDLDCGEAQFEDCVFDAPALHGTNFAGAAFVNCRFSRVRFANCNFVGASSSTPAPRQAARLPSATCASRC